jgi:hypothetical protein
MTLVIFALLIAPSQNPKLTIRSQGQSHGKGAATAFSRAHYLHRTAMHPDELPHQRLVPGDVPESSNPPSTTLLSAALEQVEQHHGEKLRQSAVAAACGMSVCAFSRACELLRQG